MENPWKDLAHDGNGYYARVDKDAILALRDKLKSNNDYALHLECKAPSACTGDINAPVYLLSANPGYNSGADAEDTPAHPDYPFAPMNPGIQDGAAEFVRERMHWIWESLAEKAGIDETAARKMAARNICEVMYFGYKSKNFAPGGAYCVPSQDYSFELVRNAIKAKKLIIIMRCQKLWQEKVPELIAYEQDKLLYTLKNHRKVFIGPGNIPDPGFDTLIETIRSRPAR